MATVLPAILREFHRRHPGIRLELNESPTSAQLAALQAGDSPAAFSTPTPHAGPRRRTCSCASATASCCRPPSARRPRHAAPARPRRGRRSCCFPRSTTPASTTASSPPSPSAGVTPRIAEEVWPRANGIGLVRAGLGATFMTPSEAQHLPPDVVFRP
jgi:DNA-binding transcriptional LysR family regulator